MTQANRQDIVTTSRRNTGIRDKIVDVFIQAVMEMCISPTLKYTWMRFLPDQQRYTYDSFWWELFTAIKYKLCTAQCVIPRSQSRLRKIEDLRQLPDFCCDNRGDPLFKDLDPEIWLSENYTRGDIAILQKFGMLKVSVDTLIDMVEQDLGSPYSRMKSMETNEDWHTDAAKMLSYIAGRADPSFLDRLHRLTLLPIRQPTPRATSWVASKSLVNFFFFAKSNAGMCIPEDVYSWVLEPEASKNQARVELFQRLGVSMADKDLVRRMILDRHRVYLEEPPSTVVTPGRIDRLFSQLYYLCKTQGPVSTGEQRQVALVDNHSRWWSSASVQPLYLPDHNPYGPHELLRKTGPGVESGSGAPGLEARFLNTYLFLIKPETSDLDQHALLRWLTRHARVRDQLMLVNRTTDQLSPECTYVARNRPEKFLGFLHHVWPFEGQEVKESQNKLRELRSLAVLCHGDQLVPFPNTYLPLADLRDRCDSFLEPGHTFPFLKIQEPMQRETYVRLNWSFLVDSASVKVKDDLTFYLDILCHLSQSPADRLQNHDRVIRLYSRIFTKFAESSDAIKDKAKIM